MQDWDFKRNRDGGSSLPEQRNSQKLSRQNISAEQTKCLVTQLNEEIKEAIKQLKDLLILTMCN